MGKHKSVLEMIKAGVANLSSSLATERFEAYLDKLIHQAQERVREEKEAIAQAKADQLVARARLDEIDPDISQLEEKAISAIRGRRPTRAKELSGQIAKLLMDRRIYETNYQLASGQILHRQALIECYEGQIQRYRDQIGLRRASENLQRSQEAIHNYGEGTLTSSSTKEGTVSPPESAEDVFARLVQTARKTKQTTRSSLVKKVPAKPKALEKKSTKSSPRNSKPKKKKD